MNRDLTFLNIYLGNKRSQDRIGGRVYYMLTQGRETNNALESKALEGFYDKFGALPVGNGTFSFR